MNRFQPSRRMTAIRMPPIADIMGRIAEMRAEGRTVYSLAQAVPWYTPPKRAMEEFVEKLQDPALHCYSPDPGFVSSRRCVARDLRDRRGIEVDPASQLHLTCGASQAFLSGLLACGSAGETVAVIEPYYFDHVFAIKFGDMKTMSISMAEEDGGWRFPMEELRSVLPGVRVLVLVNPGNPTGAVLSDGEMRELVELTDETGTFLIIDETYERFVYTGDHWHPWMDRQRDHVLTLGSYSKSLGMAGWRLGYLFGSGELLNQALKVQDSAVICPPAPAQHLLEILIGEDEWIETMSRGVHHRLKSCREALSGDGSLHWREAGGAFFTLAEYRGSLNSREAALHLLNEYGIGTIPGSAFGSAGEGHLRISFGCLKDRDVDAAMEILSMVTFPRAGS